MRKRIEVLLLLLCLSLSNSSGFTINEIMSNPESGDEWVEISVEGNIQLENIRLCDNRECDSIVCCIDEECSLPEPGDIILLFGQNFTQAATGKVLCVDDRQIGNGLGNSGDNLVLRNGDSVLQNISIPAVPKGKSYSLLDGEWYIADATPWSENAAPNEETASPVISIIRYPETIVQYGTYKLFRISNVNYPEYSDQIDSEFIWTVAKGGELVHESTESLSFKSQATTAEYSFEEAGEYEVCGVHKLSGQDDQELCFSVSITEISSEECDVSLAIETEKQVYDPGEKISFQHAVSSQEHPFEIEYWVEDLYGNIVKEISITENDNQKSYTPKAGQEQALILKAEIFPKCSNINYETYAEKMVVVKSGNAQAAPENSIVILESPEDAYFGETIKVKMHLGKGQSRKTAVSLSLKGQSKISDEVMVYLTKENQEVDIIVPLNIKDSCDLIPGEYELVASGLDREAKKKIKVSGECINAPSENEVIDKEYELVHHYCIGSKCVQVARIFNMENQEHSYKASSYIYKGSKSFSDRTENEQEVHLGPKKSAYVVLENDLEDLPEEDANIKLKIQREDRKTPFEVSEQEVFESLQKRGAEEQVMGDSGQIAPAYEKVELQEPAIPTAQVVYESSSERAKGLSKYLILGVVILGAYALLMKIKS
jgi:hypothetical protein